MSGPGLGGPDNLYFSFCAARIANLFGFVGPGSLICFGFRGSGSPIETKTEKLKSTRKRQRNIKLLVLKSTVWVKKKGYKLKTLNEGLPLEDSSDFDDFYTEWIVVTRSIIWDALCFSLIFFSSGGRRMFGGRPSDDLRTAIFAR